MTQSTASRAGELSLHAWLVRYIRRQRLAESLEWVAEQIRLDAIDQLLHTQNAGEMKSLRDVWASQMAFVRAKQ